MKNAATATINIIPSILIASHLATLTSGPLRRPPDGGVLELSPAHLFTQFFSAIANTWARRKMMLVRSIGLGLLADAFVIMGHALIR